MSILVRLAGHSQLGRDAKAVPDGVGVVRRIRPVLAPGQVPKGARAAESAHEFRHGTGPVTVNWHRLVMFAVAGGLFSVRDWVLGTPRPVGWKRRVVDDVLVVDTASVDMRPLDRR